MLQDLLLCNSSFKFICGTAHRLAIWRSGDQSVTKTVFVEIKVLSQMYLGFHLKKFPETAHRTALSFGTADVGLAAISHYFA